MEDISRCGRADTIKIGYVMYENSLLLLGLRKCFRFLTPEKAVCSKIFMEFCNVVVTFTTPPL